MKDPSFNFSDLDQANERNLLLRSQKDHEDRQKKDMSERMQHLTTENTSLEKEVSSLSEFKEFNLKLKEERNKLKEEFDDVHDSNKDLYDENCELLKQMMQCQLTLGQRESYIVSLNSIIVQLKDKNEFDLDLKRLAI